MKEILNESANCTEDSSNVGAAIKAVLDLHGSHIENVESLKICTVPAGVRLHDLTPALDARAPGPRRIKAIEQAHTLQAFAQLVNRHKAGNTAVWADGTVKSGHGQAGQAGPIITAVIDYHHQSEGTSGPIPAWCEHKVSYRFPFTASFARWQNAKQLSQRDFLKFVQERARELVDPIDLELPDKGTLVRDTMLDVMRAAGRTRADREAKSLADFYGDAAHLVDVARRISSKHTCEVKEVDRGLGGVTVTFEDDKRVQGVESAREYYLLEVEVFPGSSKATMAARLRAEATDGGLLLGLELVGVDRVIEAAFGDACEFVHKETGVPVYQGATG